MKNDQRGFGIPKLIPLFAVLWAGILALSMILAAIKMILLLTELWPGIFGTGIIFMVIAALTLTPPRKRSYSDHEVAGSA